MRKIDAILNIRDQEYRQAFSLLLMSTGYFNVIMNRDDEKSENLVENEAKHDLNEGDIREIFFTDENIEVDCPMSIHFHEDRKIKNDIHRMDKKVRMNIYKFTPFSEIIKILYEEAGLYKEVTHDGLNSGKIKIISVSELAGGWGSTTIAKSLGRIFYREGYSPLFMDLSPVSVDDTNSYSSSESDIGRLLYLAKRDRSIDLSMFISEKDDIQFIRRNVFNGYAHLIDKTFINKLKRAALECGRDILILDMGSHIDKKNLEILELSDFNIMILPGNLDWIIDGMKGLNECLKVIPCRNYMVINDRLGALPRGWLDEETESRKKNLDGIIPYCGNLTERSLDTEFGREIRRIMEGLESRNDWN